MRYSQHILHVLCLVLFAFSSWAQSESEVRKNADKLFEEEAYIAATPLYLQLLNLYPTDPELNFRYGTCSLFNDDKQKQDAIKFLNVATKSASIDPRAYYFKGKALHLNYQFDEARKFYELYQTKRESRDDRYDVDREIEMCRNGKKLMIQFTDIVVSEKTQIEEDKFFRLYKDMESIGGDILVTERFQSKIDKKKGHIPIVHYPKNAKAVYYSSYGESGKTGLDIYVRKKLPDNTWGEPYRLPGEINTEYDEDFPYLHPNGRYLYFSSKGHNSMGGFDVFMARLNPDNGQFQAVENVDFAISSPDDDLFYIVDADYQNAYFASARQSEQGKLHVYRVKVIRIPIQEIIVMGDFISEINPENKNLSIEIVSEKTGSEVGKMTTNAEGKYSYVFPKGGKYNLTIKIDGLEPITKTIDLPFLDEFRPLKQKIVHYEENGEEKVKIIDLFDEDVEGGEALVAQVLRKKSNLEVNINDFDVDELKRIESEAKRDELLAELGFQGMTVREVQDQLNELAGADTKRSEQVKQLKAGISEAYIALSAEVDELTAKRDVAIAKAENETDPAKKYAALLEAQKLDAERTKLLDQAEGLMDLSGEVTRKYGSEDLSNGMMAEIEEEFNRLIEEGKEEEAFSFLAQQKNRIETARGNSMEGMVDKLIETTIEQRARQNELTERNQKNNREIEIATTRTNALESQLPNAKRKEAEEIQTELDELQNTIKLYEKERDYNQAEIVAISNKIAVLDAQVEVIQSAGTSVLKEIDQRKFEEAQAAIEAQRAKDRAEELSNQIAQLESANPDVHNSTASAVDASQADVLINTHKSLTQQIEKNQNDRKNQVESLIAQNEQTINQVEQRLSEIEEKLADDPQNATLKNDQVKLNRFKEELEAEQSQLTNELKNSQSTATSVLTQEKVLNTISPNYLSQIASIEGDLSLTELERLQQLQAADETLRNTAEDRLFEVQQALQNNPTNNDLLTELQLLNDLLYDTNEAITDRTTRINRIENQTPDVAITREDVIADVDPDYQKTVKAIQSNPSFSEQQRLEAMNRADQQLKTSVETKLSQVESSLVGNPNDPELNGEKQMLEDILNDLTKSIDSRESRIATLSTTPSETFNREEAIAAALPNYGSDLESINTNERLSPLEKLQQTQNLENELIAELQKQLDEVQSELEANPSDAQLKQKEKGLVETIRAVQSGVDQRSEEMAALNTSNNTAGSLVVTEALKNDLRDQLFAEKKIDYAERLEQINESSGSEVQRNLNRLELEQEVLTALREKRDDAQTALNQNPDNQQAAVQFEALEQLIDAQAREVENQREASLNASKSAEVYEETIAKADRKYSVEIGDLTSAANPSAEKIVKREQQFQENLQKELAKKQKELERNYSAQVDLESMILANEIEESRKRQTEAQNATNVVTTAPADQETFVSELRKSSISIGEIEFTRENPSVEEARAHEEELQTYLSELNTKKAEIQSELERTPNDEMLTNQLMWIQQEEDSVQQELKRMAITIGDLESTAIASTSSRENDTELKELQTKRTELQNQLNDPNLSSSEQKAIIKELDEVNEAELKRSNELQSVALVESQEKQDNLNNALQRLGENDPETTEVKSALKASEEERVAITQILEQSDKAKSEEERKYLLAEATERQDVLNTRLERVIENREIQSIEDREEITVLSREELEQRRRNFVIEIGDLEVQQKRINQEIAQAKRKELPALNNEKEAIDAQLELLKNQLEHIETRIANIDESEPVNRMATIGLDQEISFKEERELASSEAYKKYIEEGVKALEIENDLRTLQQDLDRERAELIQVLAQPESTERTEIIELKTAKIKELEGDIQQKNRAFEEQMAVADQLLPTDEQEAMKLKNLLVRGVQPIKTAIVATAVLQMPTTGFAIDPNAKSIYSEENPIPVGVKNPSGLTYRVQIGAFARPIPQDLFSEFNPVSGEKIANTNITRYMAGFFNSSESVIDAREAIRRLGYNDAFVVAYCDGERITFGEARRLEASGACVPKGTNELVLEVAENTADHLGIPTETEVVELPEYAYNQAPGAAKAAPIELKQGLFFTVQVGVFNRPVSEEVVKNLPEILTVRLPNGLIRYSTGMFDSAEEAQPRRSEAINRGISDAFIVAYYKGERLTVGKARKLLDELGPSILQSNSEKTTPTEVVEIPTNVQRTDSVSASVVEASLELEEEKQKIQIVTKKTFDAFPRDVLNRYNTEGNFYFDESDGKVKSEIYSSKKELPRLFKFEKDIDTLYLSDEDVQNERDKRHILVKLSDDKVPGDLADWLLRMGYQKKFVKTKEGLELRIEGIEPNRLQDVQYHIREVGLEPIPFEIEEENNN